MSRLPLDIARQCLDRAMARATQEFNRPVCVAVCDSQGFLLVFARMEGPPVRSIQISQGKVCTAARMGTSTEAVLARAKKEGIEIGYFCDPLLTSLPGGSVLNDESGTIVGAIGVSGLTSAEEQLTTDSVAALVFSGCRA